MTRVMICDRNLFIREGIKQMLIKFDDFDIIHETDGPAATLQGLHELRPDVCVLDTAIGGYPGLGFIRAAKKHVAQVPLVAMSMCHERDFALRALRAGATGYVPKDCTDLQLAEAVRTVAKRRPYVSDTMCELIVESINEGRPSRQHDKFSDTDFEIFCMMAEGISAIRIAELCKLSVASVRTRKGRIMQQMGMRTEADVVDYAMKRKLIAHPFPVFER